MQEKMTIKPGPLLVKDCKKTLCKKVCTMWTDRGCLWSTYYGHIRCVRTEMEKNDILLKKQLDVISQKP